jgi:hypothetical protein
MTRTNQGCQSKQTGLTFHTRDRVAAIQSESVTVVTVNNRVPTKGLVTPLKYSLSKILVVLSRSKSTPFIAPSWLLLNSRAFPIVCDPCKQPHDYVSQWATSTRCAQDSAPDLISVTHQQRHKRAVVAESRVRVQDGVNARLRNTISKSVSSVSPRAPTLCSHHSVQIQM